MDWLHLNFRDIIYHFIKNSPSCLVKDKKHTFTPKLTAKYPGMSMWLISGHILLVQQVLKTCKIKLVFHALVELKDTIHHLSNFGWMKHYPFYRLTDITKTERGRNPWHCTDVDGYMMLSSLQPIGEIELSVNYGCGWKSRCHGW